MLLKEEVRENLRSGPCASCGKHISQNENHTLTFCRGKFVILHMECAGHFLEYGTSAPPRKGEEGMGKERYQSNGLYGLSPDKMYYKEG